MNEESLKAKLKVIAKEKAMTFNQIWKQLLLERFLARLAKSDYQEKFIFKGGLLLASYIEIGRETIDIDFSLSKLKGEAKNIEMAFREIINIPINDGMAFLWDKVDILSQPHMEYDGFRVSLNANYGKMTDRIFIDIGIGDTVNPVKKKFPPFEYNGKPIFEDEITLLVYPLETIFAEKLETIVTKGVINSRMKDYHDLYLMIREIKLITSNKLDKVIAATFAHRGTKLIFPILFEDSGVQSLQKLWTNHLRGLGHYKDKLKLPDQISELIAELNQWLVSQVTL